MEEGFFGKYIENYHVAVESPEKQFEKFVSDNGVNYYIRIPYVTNNYLDCSRDNNTYTHGFKELNNNLVLFKFNLNTNQLYCSEDYEVIIGFTCQNEICTNAEIGAFYHDAETIVYEGSNMYEVVQQSMLRENNFIEEVRAEFPDNFKRLKEREYQNFSQEIKKEILQCVKFALGLSFVLKKDKDFCLSSRLEKDVHKLIEKLDDACNQKDEIAELVCKIFAKSLKAEKEDVHAFVDEIYDEMFFDIEKKCNPAFIDDFLKEENILKRNTKNTFRNLEDISDEAYWKTRKKRSLDLIYNEIIDTFIDTYVDLSENDVYYTVCTRVKYDENKKISGFFVEDISEEEFISIIGGFRMNGETRLDVDWNEYSIGYRRKKWFFLDKKEGKKIYKGQVLKVKEHTLGWRKYEYWLLENISEKLMGEVSAN